MTFSPSLSPPPSKIQSTYVRPSFLSMELGDWPPIHNVFSVTKHVVSGISPFGL